MTGAFVHTVSCMGTVVTFTVVGHDADAQQREERERAIARAADWFHAIDRSCTRFDANSEVSRAGLAVDHAAPLSEMAFEALRFALAVADETGGAFDPTLGGYRDVCLDADRRTVIVRRPVVFDLGAVAKGLAIDVAARELAAFDRYAIDAGGDLYLGGDEPWSIGIRHPLVPGAIIARLEITNAAVCTSGDYERPGHILDPRTHQPADAVASVTVVAPSAMVGDALGTAAFVLGPSAGIALLDRHGVDGLVVSPELDQLTTRGMTRYLRAA